MTRLDDVQGWILICDHCGEEVEQLFYNSHGDELCDDCYTDELEGEPEDEPRVEVDPNYPGHKWPLWSWI